MTNLTALLIATLGIGGKVTSFALRKRQRPVKSNMRAGPEQRSTRWLTCEGRSREPSLNRS
jgi:hypothetical protein